VNADRSLLLGTAALVAFVLSVLLVVTSIHAYCENRLIAGLLGILGAAVLVLLVRNRTESRAKKSFAVVGALACTLVIAVDTAFVLYSTHLCRSGQ